MEKQSLSKEIENYKEEPNETFRTNNAMTKKTLQKRNKNASVAGLNSNGGDRKNQ